MNVEKHKEQEEFKKGELKADRALKDTVSTYLAKTPMQIDIDQVELTIRQYPLQSVGVAIAIGFVIGGLARGAGVIVLAGLGRNVARKTAGNFVWRLIGFRS
jgi:hypothetical protein